jgi:hypothetical protein
MMGDGHPVGAEVDSDAFSTSSADTRAAVARTDGATSGNTDRHVHSTLADADVDPKTSSAAGARAAGAVCANAAADTAAESDVGVRPVVRDGPAEPVAAP